jgi:hypothetical protein
VATLSTVRIDTSYAAIAPLQRGESNMLAQRSYQDLRIVRARVQRVESSGRTFNLFHSWFLIGLLVILVGEVAITAIHAMVHIGSTFEHLISAGLK